MSEAPRLARTRDIPAGGIVHFGPGAFFRAFIAPYTDETMVASGGDWGITAISLKSRTALDQLVPQGCQYTAVDAAPTVIRHARSAPYVTYSWRRNASRT